jgi:small-conductance mechanosensitive channel/CRP-like cAMP-binding protein
MTGAVERLQALEPAWAGLTAIALAIVALLVVRRLAPPSERRRAGASLVFLLAALVLRLATSRVRFAAEAAPGAAQLATAAAVLGFAAVVCVVVGLTGLAAVLVFDVVLRRRAAPAVVRDLAQGSVVVVAVLVMLYRRGFDPFSLLTTSAVAGAIVGFALQNTIANVFAGIALPIERTLAIGDWIEAGAHTGRIREIKWRATTIVTKDGDSVIVPNNQLLTSEVTNLSRPTPVHRTTVRVGFHYRHPPNEVRAVLLEAARGAPDVLANPAPDCFPVDFADSAVVYALRYWIDDFERAEPIEGDVRARAWYAARRAGLEIPYPIRTVLRPEPAPVHAADDEAERLAALARVDIFAPIDGDCRKSLVAVMREVRYGAGEPILREGDPGDSLYVIHRGEVDVFVDADGSRARLATLGAGDFFGEMSLMTGERRRASCAARTDTTCYVIDQAAFRCVTEARPSVVEEVSAILAERETELVASREGLGAEARARRAREARSRILGAIRSVFFGLGGG